MIPGSARDRRRAALPALIVATYCALMAGGLAAAAAAHDLVPDAFFPPLVFLPFVLVGALILSRRPGNVIGSLLVAAGELAALGYLLGEYAILGLETAPGSLPFASLASWLSNWSWMPMLAAMFYTVLLFPTGHLASARWRAPAWIGGAILAVVTLIFAFGPAFEPRRPALENPLAIAELAPLARAVQDAFWVFIILLAIAVTAVVSRFMRAAGAERQQLKWAALGFAISAAGSLAGDSLPGVAGFIAAAIGLTAIPVSVGISILRYRLYDIDVLINRTLVYGALTAMLGGLYVAAVIGSQAVLGPLTGGGEIAVAVSTLIVVALFQPLRRRIQDVVDRRFYRSRYDAQRTLDAFAARLRDEVQLDDVRAQLISAVHATVQPRAVSLWLRNDLRTPGG